MSKSKEQANKVLNVQLLEEHWSNNTDNSSIHPFSTTYTGTRSWWQLPLGGSRGVPKPMRYIISFQRVLGQPWGFPPVGHARKTSERRCPMGTCKKCI